MAQNHNCAVEGFAISLAVTKLFVWSPFLAFRLILLTAVWKSSEGREGDSSRLIISTIMVSGRDMNSSFHGGGIDPGTS